MKVKISKCPDPEYWYRESIGKIFEVDSYDPDYYTLLKSNKMTGIIKKEDCEIIEEQKEEPFLTDNEFEKISDLFMDVKFNTRYEIKKEAQNRNWIKKSKKQELTKLIDDFKENWSTMDLMIDDANEIFDKAIAAIEEAENRNG